MGHATADAPAHSFPLSHSDKSPHTLIGIRRFPRRLPDRYPAFFSIFWHGIRSKIEHLAL